MKFLIGVFLLLFGIDSQLKAQDMIAQYQSEISRVTQIINSPEILDSLVHRVHSQSGLLRSFDEEMAMYDQEILQKKRNWVSSFRVGLNLISANTYAALDNSVTEVGILPNLGVTLTIDPEKFVNRRSYMDQALNKRQRSYYLQQDHKQALKNEILGDYYDYLLLLESLVAKERTLITRKQHLDFMEIGFRGGTVTYDQLMVVQNQFNLWESEVIETRIEARKKKSHIQVLLGY